MTAREFIDYIGEPAGKMDGKQFYRMARARYTAYVEAYRELSLKKVVWMARMDGTSIFAIAAACDDRDHGRAMAYVPELLIGG